MFPAGSQVLNKSWKSGEFQLGRAVLLLQYPAMMFYSIVAPSYLQDYVLSDTFISEIDQFCSADWQLYTNTEAAKADVNVVVGWHEKFPTYY